MISEELLRSKGTVECLMELPSDESERYDLGSVTEAMGVARSTARQRLERLQEVGLVEEGAEVIDNSPTRIYSLTQDGEELSEKLEVILD